MGGENLTREEISFGRLTRTIFSGKFKHTLKCATKYRIYGHGLPENKINMYIHLFDNPQAHNAAPTTKEAMDVE